ncbi:MAG: DUF86 domain-containing protein [Acidimicrobiaceae bacterium]|nr:DUF86 domain-containing protein [Acidimicrobiaceae bacterium]
MSEACQKIQRYVAGMTEDEFRADELRQDGVIRQITIIWEAAGRLPDQVRDHLGDIPWSDVRGMRNRLVHKYDDVNEEAVWNAVTMSVPQLLNVVQKVLTEYGEE